MIYKIRYRNVLKVQFNLFLCLILALNNPYGITWDSASNTLYISDTDNHKIKSYAFTLSTFTTVVGGVSTETSSTQLSSPRGIYYHASTTSLIIANSGANNIVRWVLGTSSWTLVAGDASGSSSTLLNGPVGVIMDSYGNIYVAGRGNERIQNFLRN